jgi:hypothetical protein
MPPRIFLQNGAPLPHVLISTLDAKEYTPPTDRTPTKERTRAMMGAASADIDSTTAAINSTPAATDITPAVRRVHDRFTAVRRIRAIYVASAHLPLEEHGPRLSYDHSIYCCHKSTIAMERTRAPCYYVTTCFASTYVPRQDTSYEYPQQG